MIIFTDIDDTLIKTARKIPDVKGLETGEITHKGENNSFIDKKRWILIQDLLLKQTCIPVTARSKASYRNLLLKFTDHAVLNFDATILNQDKKIDQDWHEHIINGSEELNQKNIFENIQNKSEILQDFEIKIVVENNISCYMNFKNLKENLTIIINELNISEKFYFYQTDRDLALIPIFIKKEHGVKYIMEKFYNENELMVGLGDHKNDLSFMKICDFIMVPTDSTLMKLIQKQ